MPYWNPVINTGQDSTVNAGSISPVRGGKTGADESLKNPLGIRFVSLLCSILPANFIEIGKNSFAIGSMADFGMPLEPVDVLFRKGDRFGIADI